MLPPCGSKDYNSLLPSLGLSLSDVHVLPRLRSQLKMHYVVFGEKFFIRRETFFNALTN